MSSAPPPASKSFTRSALKFFYQLIDGDHEWADRRAILLFIAVNIFALMGRATEQITPWEPLQPYLNTLPAPLASVFHFFISLFYFQSLRHFLPPLVGCVLAVLLASNYVRDLFELPDLQTGYRYLTASMFGWDYPSINIKEGGYEVTEKAKPGLGQQEKAETNPIPKIGGPGFVSIAPGNVALFERMGKPSKIAGAGKHFIGRFEALREVLDLRDQFRSREQVKAVTKDGVPVTVRNTQVSFRVRTGSRRRERKPDETYPFSSAAVRRIAYGKTVGARGPSVWTDGAINTVTGSVRSYISRLTFDELVSRDGAPGSSAPGAGAATPPGKPLDPREKIKAELNNDASYVKFADMGIELLWVSLGHLETPRDVIEQRIEAWEADWQGEEKMRQAEGEAYKMRAMEYARAAARLEFIERITANLPNSPDAVPSAEFILVQFGEALSSTIKLEEKLSSASLGFGIDELSLLKMIGKQRPPTAKVIDG
ncbi:MAG: SPFH domain-containing protein [Chloroflexi bacterium]|nr:SPFH domain-containing protein [Chloroflexota bacterium]